MCVFCGCIVDSVFIHRSRPIPPSTLPPSFPSPAPLFRPGDRCACVACKAYKPIVHVDEIGLTSDKYVPLNRTLSSLPLKVTIEPMSLQRWQLMQVSI